MLPACIVVLFIVFTTSDLVAQTENHCKVRYGYNVTGDRIKRDWYCWVPGHDEEKEPDAEPKNRSSSIEEMQLNVMPNPASDQLQISVPEEFASGTMDLITSTGSIVATQRVTGTITVIDVNSLPSGQYFVRFTRNDERLIAPCIID